METIRKLFSNEKLRFFTKVTVAHVITYFICGIIANNLFNYGDFVELIDFRPMEEIAPATILFGQIIRGLLFGFVIWWIKDSIVGKKRGWLKLWGILLILGFLNTYGPNSGSIEGMIYIDQSNSADVPVNALLSLLEITVQPLLFSLIVTYQRKREV